MKTTYDTTLKKWLAEQDTYHGGVKVVITGMGKTPAEAMEDCLKKLEEAKEKGK